MRHRAAEVEEQSARPRPIGSKLELACALLLPVGVLLQRLLAYWPDVVERVYSRAAFPPIVRALAAISSLVPFSLAEVVLLALLAWIALGIARSLRRLRTRTSARTLALRLLLRAVAFAGVVYCAYLVTWGLNHQRRPFGDAAGYDRTPPSVEELALLARELVAETNRLRAGLEEDEHGVSRMPHSRGELTRLSRAAYARCSDVHPSLVAAPGVPKRPLASPLLSAWWISGIYSPFTAEAHVNTEQPEPEVAFSTLHELAHSLGFAREDEANFLAWLASSRSDDPVLRYSGASRSAHAVLRALSRSDLPLALELVATFDPGVVRDEAASEAFWTSRATAVTELASTVNDAYLKSQGQVHGVRSYGMFVDLLVAHRRRASR